MDLTGSLFAQRCAYIASKAAAWAGDSLTLPEDAHRKIDAEVVARFTDELRGTLDRLDEQAGRAAPVEQVCRGNDPPADSELLAAHEAHLEKWRQESGLPADTRFTEPPTTVSERRAGTSKLVYDKSTRTIVTVRTDAHTTDRATLIERLEPAFVKDLIVSHAIGRLRDDANHKTAGQLSDWLVANNALKREAIAALRAPEGERPTDDEAIANAIESVAALLEIDWDGSEPFIRSDSIEAAVRALLALSSSDGGK